MYLNTTNKRFFGGKSAEESLKGSIDNLIEGIAKNGIEIHTQGNKFKFHEVVVDRLRRNITAGLDNGFKKLKSTSESDPPLIVVIIQETDHQSIYSHIKWWGDCCEGIPTICIQEKKLIKRDGKTSGNLR